MKAKEFMAFQIHINIPEDSRRARAVQKRAAEQHLSPDQAAEQIFDEAVNSIERLSPGEEMWGAFGAPEDASILDEAMSHVRESRASDRLRDPGQ